jgi:rRNA-processing protein FCF1
LDGNFVKLLVEKNPPFLKKLEQILNGKIFSKVTDCIINELQILGDQFRFVLAEGNTLNI